MSSFEGSSRTAPRASWSIARIGVASEPSESRSWSRTPRASRSSTAGCRVVRAASPFHQESIPLRVRRSGVDLLLDPTLLVEPGRGDVYPLLRVQLGLQCLELPDLTFRPASSADQRRPPTTSRKNTVSSSQWYSSSTSWFAMTRLARAPTPCSRGGGQPGTGDEARDHGDRDHRPVDVPAPAAGDGQQRRAAPTSINSVATPRRTTSQPSARSLPSSLLGVMIRPDPSSDAGVMNSSRTASARRRGRGRSLYRQAIAIGIAGGSTSPLESPLFIAGSVVSPSGPGAPLRPRPKAPLHSARSGRSPTCRPWRQLRGHALHAIDGLVEPTSAWHGLAELASASAR